MVHYIDDARLDVALADLAKEGMTMADDFPKADNKGDIILCVPKKIKVA